MLKTTFAKLIDDSNFSGWSQVYTFKSPNVEKLESRGDLFVAVSVTDEPGVQGQATNLQASEKFVSGFYKAYFESEELSAFEALKKSVEEIAGEFTNIEGKLEMVAISSVRNVAYLTASGGAQISLLRGGRLVKILTSNTNNKGQVVSASGYPENGDTFIAGVSLFFKECEEAEISKAFDLNNLRFGVESLASKVSATAFFLKFDENGEKDFEPKRKTVMEVSSIKSISDGFRETQDTTVSDNLPIFKNIKTEFGKIFSKLPKRKIYVQEEKEEEVFHNQNKKVSVSVGIIFLTLLIVSVGFGLWQKKQKDFKASYETKLEQAEHELNEAEEIYAISPIRSRELFFGSREKLLEMKNEGIEDPLIDNLISKLEEIRGKILGEYAVETELFVDLSLLSSGFVGDYIASSDETIYILDSGGEKVVGIDIDSKRSEVVAGPAQVDEAKGLTVYSDRIFVFEPEGIFEVGKTREKIVENEWGSEALIHAYAGNIYVLDKNNSSVGRYAGVGEKFSSKNDWLADEVDVDLSDANSWIIDGAVWVLTNSGDILKFSLGNPISFSLSGIFPELSNPKAIYTDEELEYLYILDSDNKRVVVVSKDGEYKAQYVADGIGEGKSLVVSEKEKIIILLTGEKLVSVEMKHLD
ncbi:hypothetical protein KKB40_02940 [Patescibacteria group bacterium]|nr:hypothetical protein [Patescibacteria group bacterium]